MVKNGDCEIDLGKVERDDRFCGNTTYAILAPSFSSHSELTVGASKRRGTAIYPCSFFFMKGKLESVENVSFFFRSFSAVNEDV